MARSVGKAFIAICGFGNTGTIKLGPAIWLPTIWLLFVFGCALSADWWPLPPLDQMHWENLAAGPGTVSLSPLAAPNAADANPYTIHLLGTDSVGRDILSRLLAGARVSLTVGLFSTLIGMVLGGGLGMLAGYYRGRIETIIVGAIDCILAFPTLVLLLTVTHLLGASLFNITLALGFVVIPAFCRVARANTLKLSGLEFVQAAKAAGARDRSIILRELLPNVLIPLSVYALVVAGFLIIAEGGLGFLGLSVPAPAPSWGGMVAEGQGVLKEAPHVSLIPMLVMFLTILSFNLLGDRLRSLTDVRESRL